LVSGKLTHEQQSAAEPVLKLAMSQSA